ncbi:type IV toxin-antitoxin system AbiEi family antitoxin domain-containing protein [Nocardioides sp. YIM 152588]|uniref:type IV toxin-antitoxin system AbiEi family antitoxin domain-containing protein n=1 Tax=Nocardioides sp. YIM 152588 TaxID=3158259 RepID=UPI0032E3D479
MNARALALMARQWGLITRPQAVRAGMQPDQIDRLVRRGVWTIVRRGVYAEASYAATFTSERDQRLLRDRAASLRIRAAHVWSHHSAAYLLGLEVLHQRPAVTHVTRPGVIGSHHRYGVTHHLAPYAPRDVIEIDGVRCLRPARTALDIAREHGFRHGLVAADAALRSGTTRGDLELGVAVMRYWPGVTTARDVIASASPDTDSAGETLARLMVTSLGHGVPEVQLGLTADGRTAWCDLRLGRHVFEFDGRVKYQRLDEGGIATGPAGDVVWREKRRQDFVCGFKLGMSRLVWDDLLQPSWERTARRLNREYRETCRLFGTDARDLAAYRPRGPRPRPAAPPVGWPGAA